MSDRPVDHLDLVVTDLDRSLEFYNGLLEPLGFIRNTEIVGERGERVVYLGGSGGASVSLRQAQSDAHPVPYDRYAVGIHHLCFGAASREVVEERAAWLRGRGAAIESGPRSTSTCPVTTRSSSTTRMGSSSRSSTVHRRSQRRLGRTPAVDVGKPSQRWRASRMRCIRSLWSAPPSPRSRARGAIAGSVDPGGLSSKLDLFEEALNV